MALAGHQMERVTLLSKDDSGMVQDALVEAIGNYQVIRFTADSYVRVGEPHLIGITEKTGHMQLEMYQTGGDVSESSRKRGGLPSWKRFNIEDISGVAAAGPKFVRRPDFNPDCGYWSRIIASVE